MGTITVNNSVAYLISNQKVTPLLAMTNFLTNKSSVPMHSLENNGKTITDLILRLVKANDAFPDASDDESTRYLTIDFLIAAELVKSAAPVKVAEFGCTRGRLSYNLTEVLGKFNTDSNLCLISNTIGNNSGNTCLDFITQAEEAPEWSMLYSDYTKTNLAENGFDIVVINGEALFDDPYTVIKEAERITKPGGYIICSHAGDSLLDAAFRLIYSNPAEYCLTQTDGILTARKDETSWSATLTADPYAEVPVLLQKLHALVDKEDGSIENYRPFAKEFKRYISIAISRYDITKKLELIHLNETLLDYINNLSTKHLDFYREKLLALLAANK